MALNDKVFTALLHIFACLFLDILEISNGSQGNMDCLKSIKNSLEDPHRYLKDSWDFSKIPKVSFENFMELIAGTLMGMRS